MNLIICVDDGWGMAFHRRRQSRDRVLRAHILRLTAGGVLWMNGYSARQFGASPQIRVAENFLAAAGAGEFCFAEITDPAPYEARAEKLFLFHWNRRYPSDLQFAAPTADSGWRLEQTAEFAGFSHEKITEEVYAR